MNSQALAALMYPEDLEGFNALTRLYENDVIDVDLTGFVQVSNASGVNPVLQQFSAEFFAFYTVDGQTSEVSLGKQVIQATKVEHISSFGVTYFYFDRVLSVTEKEVNKSVEGKIPVSVLLRYRDLAIQYGIRIVQVGSGVEILNETLDLGKFEPDPKTSYDGGYYRDPTGLFRNQGRFQVLPNIFQDWNLVGCNGGKWFSCNRLSNAGDEKVAMAVDRSGYILVAVPKSVFKKLSENKPTNDAVVAEPSITISCQGEIRRLPGELTNEERNRDVFTPTPPDRLKYVSLRTREYKIRRAPEFRIFTSPYPECGNRDEIYRFTNQTFKIVMQFPIGDAQYTTATIAAFKIEVLPSAYPKVEFLRPGVYESDGDASGSYSSRIFVGGIKKIDTPSIDNCAYKADILWWSIYDGEYQKSDSCFKRKGDVFESRSGEFTIQGETIIRNNRRKIEYRYKKKVPGRPNRPEGQNPAM